MEMNHKLLIILIIFVTSISVEAQRFVPIPVLPGNSYTVDSKNDTLWIINNRQFKKTIATKEKFDNCLKQNELLKAQTDTLKELVSIQKSLIDTLKNDRNYYIDNWKKAENDLGECTTMLKKQSNHTKTAIIVGAATTVSAFILGFILGIK